MLRQILIPSLIASASILAVAAWLAPHLEAHRLSRDEWANTAAGLSSHAALKNALAQTCKDMAEKGHKIKDVSLSAHLSTPMDERRATLLRLSCE